MMTIALYITIAMVVLAAILNAIRLIKGPDAPDRVLALDTLYINAIALIVLLGITLQTRMYRNQQGRFQVHPGLWALWPWAST